MLLGMLFTAGTGGGGETLREQPAQMPSRTVKQKTGHLGRKFGIIMMLRRLGLCYSRVSARIGSCRDVFLGRIYWKALKRKALEERGVCWNSILIYRSVARSQTAPSVTESP